MEQIRELPDELENVSEKTDAPDFDGGLSHLVLYETPTRYYIVGSNAVQSRFKVLKIDRSEPKELVIHDDRVEYNEGELADLLTSLDQGNRGKGNKSTFVRRLSAFGLLGFVRFLEGYFMVLVTKRRKVATIGYHFVYKIEETETVPLAADIAAVASSPHEQRYHKTFQSIDLSSNFYYSHSYDITHTLQHNMALGNNLELVSGGEPAWRFVWNEYLLKQLLGNIGNDWIVPVIHGYVCQSEITVFSRCVLLTVLARRSNRFAGTRFLKRGANPQGHVANEIEVEQILHDTTHRNRRFTSFVQIRGSVPGYWSQEGSKMVPKPPIVIHRHDPFSASAGAHFRDLLGRYGSPICCLNLVKKREQRKHESLLTEELLGAIGFLNQFLPADQHIRYTGFDMSRANKRGVALDNLEVIARRLVKHCGFFCSFPELFCHLFRCDPFYRDVQRVPGEELVDVGFVSFPAFRQQHGTIRINCVDCLDRTNTAAFVVGKCVLGLQVYALGLTDSPHLDFDTDAVRMLEDMFEDIGNVLALQYGGSQLVHRVDSYRQHGWGTNSKDWMRTISRYYSNTFSDFEKQAAINLFLGVFEPAALHRVHLWDLQTDYFLHHPWIHDPSKHPRAKSYSQWLTPDITHRLPAAQEAAVQSIDHYVPFDAFAAHYKTYQLGSFKEIFTSLIPNTIGDYMPTTTHDPSPFTARSRPAMSILPVAMLPSATSVDRLDSGTVSANFSSDGTHGSDFDEGMSSSEATEGFTLDRGRSQSRAFQTAPSRIPSKMPSSAFDNTARTGFRYKFKTFEETYGVKLKEPSAMDRQLYQRYAKIYHNATRDLSGVASEKLSDRVRSSSTHLVQRSVFTSDSSYGVTPPTVNRRSREIYRDFVERGAKDPERPSVANMEMYRRFISLT
ncbi:Polyphosphoinositide phosphatase [Hypsibius exemplaris]|uniref:Polyphosphoinositide phosphatase n=1 Tax=Hypsibius exemplaris TaxID=2072580 RepID=A0A1W0W9I2_HYPEX|nr:Polyphosphoinositide phosphatase [Hypsibius exemplaris]